MLATTIHSPPSADDYISLTDYQSQTPASFSQGKPVLHFHLDKALASIPKSQSGILALFPDDASSTERINGDAEHFFSQEVSVFVNSEHFTIYSESIQLGVSIPYPAISIHAVKQVVAHDNVSTRAVWMQLEFSDGGVDDDDFKTVELTVVPSGSEDAQRVYDAVANCSNLHPDPVHGAYEEDEEGQDQDQDQDQDHWTVWADGEGEEAVVPGLTGVLRGVANGGLPPPMPGSGGWITAENVTEYFDEGGNWIGGREGGAEEGGLEEEADDDAEALGEVAGRTRPRREVDGEGTNGGDGADTKRPRVE